MKLQTPPITDVIVLFSRAEILKRLTAGLK